MKNTKKLTTTALFAAIATVVMFIEFPLPFMPPFLQVDLSGAVILIAVLAIGTKEAIFVLAIKDVIHFLSTKTGGVGELADFIMTLSMILALALVVRYFKGKRAVYLGLATCVIALVLVGTFTNKYLLIPFYSKLMPLDAIVAMCQAVNPNITDITGYLIWGVMPFNAVKGIIVSVVTALLYKRVGSVLKK